MMANEMNSSDSSEAMNQSVRPDADGSSEFAREFEVRAHEVEDKLSSNDRRIVSYLRANLDELPFHTANSLGLAAGVSRAAIVRLAHRLGYEGFAELRQRALQELKSGNRSPLARFQAGDSSTTELGLKLQQDRENLALTETLAEQEIERASRVLSQATRVQVIGNGVSSGLALYFQRILHGVRPDVHFVEATFPDALARLTPEDAVVVLLFRRYSRLTAALLERARASGAAIVLISDGGGQRFAADRDVVLIAATESVTLYRSMVAPIFVLEAVVSAVAAADPDRTRLTLEEREQFNSEEHLLLGDESTPDEASAR
jgi:DNA-binding MurR/RpiR family transcriptional regulator